MSAFVVNRRHIDAIVTGALEVARRQRSGSFRWYVEGEGARALTQDNADEIGQMLWTENIISVQTRYPDWESAGLPGPIDLDPDAVYVFERLAQPLTPIELIKALNCYEYQSCEHDGWRESGNVARALVEALTAQAIRYVDGYDDAPWEVPSDLPTVRTYSRAI